LILSTSFIEVTSLNNPKKQRNLSPPAGAFFHLIILSTQKSKNFILVAKVILSLRPTCERLVESKTLRKKVRIIFPTFFCLSDRARTSRFTSWISLLTWNSPFSFCRASVHLPSRNGFHERSCHLFLLLTHDEFAQLFVFGDDLLIYLTSYFLSHIEVSTV